MDCRAFEERLAMGADAESDSDLSAHLSGCPSCRGAAREFTSLGEFFDAAAHLDTPDGLTASVKAAVRAELDSATARTKDRWTDIESMVWKWLLPYSVAGATSLLVTASLLWLLLASGGGQEGIVFAPADDASNDVVFLDSTSEPKNLNDSRLSASDLAASRAPVSAGSPTVNPSGSIMALASALTSGRIRGDELVIVASILGDGTAELEKIVKPLDDQDTIFEIQQAMAGKGGDAPFVPASLDSRPERELIIFRVQRVDVRAPAGRQTRR